MMYCRLNRVCRGVGGTGGGRAVYGFGMTGQQLKARAEREAWFHYFDTGAGAVRRNADSEHSLDAERLFLQVSHNGFKCASGTSP